jgi:serine protease Do
MMAGKFLFFVLPLIAVAVAPGFSINATAQTPAKSKKASASPVPLESLEKHFQNAKTYFENKDYNRAASEIRAGAGIIKQEAEKSAAQGKETLTHEVEQLDALADRVQKGTVKSVNEISDSVSRANSALAEYFSSKASKSWSQKAAAETGEYLKAAADYLEKAWQWSGRRADTAAETALRAARKVGDKLQAQTSSASEEVTNALDNLKAEILKLMPASSASAAQPLKMAQTKKPESTSLKEALTTGITKVAQSSIPAVVAIEVTEGKEVQNPFLPFEGSPFWRKFFSLPKKMPKKFKEELMGLGTGIIVDPEGHILTNNHVVAGAATIKVLLSNGLEYPATLVGTDPKTDLGVVKISTGKPLPYLNFGNSDDVVVGQWVVAIGQPRGLGYSVTQGIISAKHRTGIIDPVDYQDFLQTDAAINPGNSGGPLLTLEGLVIGVNSAILTKSGGFEGIGFSIPSSMAVHIANELIEYGKVERGWLGVSIENITPEMAKSLGLTSDKGAFIADVMKGGPADLAGLKKGDVVLEYKGEKVTDESFLRNKVAATTIGKEVRLVVWRDKKEMQFTVKIGNLEELTKRLVAIVKQRLGVEVAPVTSQEAEQYGLPSNQGVDIQWVDPKGPLGKASLEVGDLILAIDQVPVSGVDAFVNMVSSLPPHQKIALLARDHRTGKTGYVQVEID